MNTTQKYTFEEYLALEEKVEFKSEFWNGIMIAMTEKTPTHGKIANSVGQIDTV